MAPERVVEDRVKDTPKHPFILFIIFPFSMLHFNMVQYVLCCPSDIPAITPEWVDETPQHPEKENDCTGSCDKLVLSKYEARYLNNHGPFLTRKDVCDDNYDGRTNKYSP